MSEIKDSNDYDVDASSPTPSQPLGFSDLLTGNMPWWGITVRGMGMGVADVVPGVSGGTMALILGIYSRFIGALSKINLDLLKAVPALLKSSQRQIFFRAVREADLMFLVCLGVGIVTAIGSFAKIIPWLIENYPAQMNGFFFGMIIGSIVLPFKMMEKRGPVQFVTFLIATVFAFWFSNLPLLATAASHPFLFVCGAIAICAMLLPGVSGSFLLLVLGQYKYVLDSLRELNVVVIAVFGSGCAFGLLSFSRLLRWLLAKFPSSTLAALCGLMIGSLSKLWPYKDVSTKVMVGKKVVSSGTNVPPWSEAHNVSMMSPLVLMIVGLILVLLLERIGSSRTTRENQ